MAVGARGGQQETEAGDYGGLVRRLVLAWSARPIAGGREERASGGKKEGEACSQRREGKGDNKERECVKKMIRKKREDDKGNFDIVSLR